MDHLTLTTSNSNNAFVLRIPLLTMEKFVSHATFLTTGIILIMNVNHALNFTYTVSIKSNAFNVLNKLLSFLITNVFNAHQEPFSSQIPTNAFHFPTSALTHTNITRI